MGRFVSLFGWNSTARLASAVCLAGSLAGCADSERMTDPFGNPFHTASRGPDATPTGAIGDAAPSQSVQSRPLAAPGAPANRPVAAYTAPAHSNERFASANEPAPSSTSLAGWTAEGGMPIVVAQGESVGIVAHRYGIPEAALLRTNGFSSAAQVRPGTRLVIPVYNASLAASSGVHVGDRKVAAAHDLQLQERRKKTTAEAKAKRTADKIAKTDAARGPKPDVKTAAKAEKLVHAEAAVAATEPKKATDSTPAMTGHVDAGKTSVVADAPEFRWPARGRVILAFKAGGNDGINIALPEGTSVKAADAGVVAYAGNQLKGYGNLILIRHANGYVTAYANNGEIDVVRGDEVKRGQVIAKSGQTGNVSTPQLHFEVRKGAKPVDPILYLADL
jgi:murein DD-endopeptidase MepM/ murein hydrolase activator NlpD